MCENNSVSFARISRILFLIFLIPFSIFTVMAIPVLFVGGAVSGGQGHAAMFIAPLLGLLEWIALQRINRRLGAVFLVIFLGVFGISIGVVYWIFAIPVAVVAILVYVFRRLKGERRYTPGRF